MQPATYNLQPIMPTHIAIIMDGNRRWAKAKKLPVYAGHQFVANELLERLVEHASDLGIKYITFWAWSTENWQRSSLEVKAVMKIFKSLLERSMRRLHEKGVRIKTIGNIDAFPKDIADGVKAGIEKTKNNKKITAIFALNYGGRDEIIRAVNTALSKKFSPFPISLSPETFSTFLDTVDFPDPDLIIRTGGEKRLSGFLLWQSEYAELYFTDLMMPDFTPERLDDALEDFAKRKRRYGK